MSVNSRIKLTELVGGRVGFFLEGGKAVPPFGGVDRSLPVNLFKLSNKSEGIKSFVTPFVAADASFLVPSMNGSRQPLLAGCTTLTVPAAGTMLSVAEDIVISVVKTDSFKVDYIFLFPLLRP